MTIGTKQSGLKEESFNLMLQLGFNKEGIILKGDLLNPDFEEIMNNFFK
jgi:hypothetical protein